MIVEPWGLNFKERSRTLITQLSKSDENIARKIVYFLAACKNEPKSNVLS